MPNGRILKMNILLCCEMISIFSFSIELLKLLKIIFVFLNSWEFLHNIVILKDLVLKIVWYKVMACQDSSPHIYSTHA